MRSGGDNAPSRLFWDKEDIFGRVFVLILFETVTFRDKILILRLRAIRYVFQEYKPKHNGFVFRSVHISAQNAGYVPNLFFKADMLVFVSAMKSVTSCE